VRQREEEEEEEEANSWLFKVNSKAKTTTAAS
jgi:hypothetical protein